MQKQEMDRIFDLVADLSEAQLAAFCDRLEALMADQGAPAPAAAPLVARVK